MTAFCPSCEPSYGEGRTGAFNWQIAVAGEMPRFAQYALALRKARDLRLGSLWECRNCKGEFWLNASKSEMTAIPAKRRSVFHRWASIPPRLDPAVYDRIKVLEPVDCDAPASVLFHGYSQYTIAVIRMEADPSILLWSDENVGLGTDIAVVRKCEYALPRSVRAATHVAPFIELAGDRMEMKPTAIRSPRGRIFFVDGLENFFAYGNLRGSDMELATKPTMLSKWLRPISVGFPRKAVTWILVEPQDTSSNPF